MAMPGTSSTSVRIKRTRDEPSLPGFTLGRPVKRPSLAGLSLAAEAPAEDSARGSSCRRRRYRLVATVTANGRPVLGPSAFAGCREQQQRRVGLQQVEARYQRVASRRTSALADGLQSGVLDLVRCSARRPSRLVPFGPPLPPASLAAHTWSALPPEDGPHAHIWRDAAAAAAQEEGASPSGASCAAEPDDDCVFDIYEETQESGSEGACSSQLDQELCWDEDDDIELDGGDSAGSDSQGEVDYPDEESEGEDTYF